MIEKSSQATVWLQFNMWSLTDVDNIPLTHLPVLGDTPWCCEIRTFICLSFTIIGSCAASTLKFLDKVGLQGFRNAVFKSKIIHESVTCLKNDFKFAKFQMFTNTSVQSLFGDTGNIP